MRKMLSKKILLSLLFLALGAGAFFYYQTTLVKKEKLSLQTGALPWELALDEVEKVWRGDFSLTDNHVKNNCPHIFLEKDVIPKALKACRPELFACYFMGRSLSVREGTQFKKVEVQFPENWSSKHFPFDLAVIDGEKEKKYRFKLNNSCRKVSLPQGFYWGSDEKPIEKRIFHTSDIHYRIDRYLVRNLDIHHWIKLLELKPEGNLKKIMEMKGEDFFKPAVSLKPEQMKKYCHFRGGQILDSYIKAALTYHHGRESLDQLSKTPPSSASAPHPFGPRKTDLVGGCDQVFSKECVGKEAPFTFAMGWSGVAELVGGPMEYVINKRFPRKNIHPSSYYFPLDSKVHEAGKRIFWNGNSFESLDFNFGLLPAPERGDKDKIDVGFRCMEVSLK